MPAHIPASPPAFSLGAVLALALTLALGAAGCNRRGAASVNGELQQAVRDGGGLLFSSRSWDGQRSRYHAVATDAEGRVRWKLSDRRAVLLFDSPAAPVLAIADAPDAARIELHERWDGRLRESFVVPIARKSWDTWIWNGKELYVFQSEVSPGATVMHRIDIDKHAVVWSATTELYVMPYASISESGPAYAPDVMWLYCEDPRGSHDRYACRFSTPTGALLGKSLAPVEAMAQESPGADLVFLAHGKSVEAVSAATGATVWQAPLPEGVGLRTVVAGPGYVAALALGSRAEQRPDLLLAYQAQDGAALWKKEALPHGEHFWPALAAAGDRIAYISNISPNWRVLDARGQQLQGGELRTDFVVTTEAAGGFVRDLKGRPILLPGMLLLQRDSALHRISVP